MIYFILAVIALNLWFAHRKGLIDFNGCYKKHPILTKVITFCIFFFGTLAVVEVSELRKEFEARAYSNKWNINRCVNMGIDYYADDFVDGAWHAFQERQKQIDDIKEYVSKLEFSSSLSVQCVYDDLQELLK